MSTCYQDAVSRLDKIHEKNEEYSVKTERNHLMRMKRNSGKDQNLLTRSRMKSAENRKVAVDVNLERERVLEQLVVVELKRAPLHSGLLQGFGYIDKVLRREKEAERPGERADSEVP